MKKFIYNILIFVLPVWFVLMMADFMFSSIAKRSNDYAIESWYDLMKGSIKADVIIMGSSRAWVQYDPLILDSILSVNSYNLGIDGRKHYSQIKKYHLFKKRNKKPRLIIQNIDIFDFNAIIRGYNMYQFYPYFWDRDMRIEFINNEPFNAGEKYLPLYRFINYSIYNDINTFLPTDSNYLTKGYRGKTATWDGAALMKVDSISFLPNDTVLHMFDTYLAEARADGIKVLFVYAPIYIGATRKMKNIKKMRDTYQTFANKYEIPILDYTHMDICYDTTYFYNASHLNKRGAEVFSDSLASDIKRLGILNN